MKRRRFLASVGAAAALSGCSPVGGNTASEYAVGELVVQNLTDESHQLQILILDGDDPVSGPGAYEFHCEVDDREPVAESFADLDAD
ncbi:hypothetical protein [Haloprofundus halobius]|uniref:hypothetical protein n=1 Tax=Haloprofundus halobius TaxID=2876194 RepID=UPI001CD006C7|nr:hypothetical protein [Haloprofundus halobius]